VTTDAFGNVTQSWSNQEYIVIAGMAKLLSVTSESLGTSADGNGHQDVPLPQ